MPYLNALALRSMSRKKAIHKVIRLKGVMTEILESALSLSLKILVSFLFISENVLLVLYVVGLEG